MCLKFFAVELFCCDKFEETHKQESVCPVKVNKPYFTLNISSAIFEILTYLQYVDQQYAMNKKSEIFSFYPNFKTLGTNINS